MLYLYGDGDSGARVRKYQTLEEFDVGSGMTEAFSQSWTETISSSMFRSNVLSGANNGTVKTYDPYAQYAQHPQADYLSYLPSKNKPLNSGSNQRLTNVDAMQQIKDAGLEKHLTVPSEGYTQKALNIIVERKLEELERQYVIERADGFGNRVGQFAAGAVAQVLDPANFLQVLMPELVPARIAMMMKTGSALEKAGARALVGAVGGVAGNALAEPIIYAAKKQEQADYDMTDSLLNIALGGVLGGGLHMTGGWLADRFRTRKALANPKTRLREKIALEANAVPSTRGSIDLLIEKTEAKIDNLRQKIPQQFQSPLVRFSSKQEVNELEKTLKALTLEQASDSKASLNKLADTYQKQGLSGRRAKVKAKTDIARRQSDISSKISTIKQDLQTAKTSLKYSHIQRNIEALEQEKRNLTQLSSDNVLGDLINNASPVTREYMLRTALQMEARGYHADVKAVAATDKHIPIDDVQGKIKETATHSFSHRNSRGANDVAAKEAEKTIAISDVEIDKEMSDLESYFAEFETMTGTKSDLSEFEQLIKAAEIDAKALGAAMMCGVNR